MIKVPLIGRGATLINPKWDEDTPCIPTQVLTTSGENKISIRQAKKHMEDIRHYCITKSPNFASVTASVDHIILTPGHPMWETVAYTDGRAVYYGKGYFAETQKAQAAVNIHEVLHVALRHCQRAKALYDNITGAKHTGKNFNSYVWNLAVDACVNLATFSVPWVATPKCGVINFKDLLDEQTLKDWPPHTWSSEALYFNLMDQMEASKKGGKGSKQGQKISDMVDEIAKAMDDIRNGKASPGSLRGDVMAGEQQVKGECQDELRNWNARLSRAAAGERAGGLLRNALFDMPETPTPWESHLRRLVTQAVMPQTELTMCKPSRHMISNFAFAKQHQHRRTPFFPGSQPKKGIKSIVVCVDTSGSINEEILMRFCAEIQQIKAKVAAQITIISCDAEVHQIIDIPPFKSLQQAMTEVDWKLKGGGGTDFRPAVEAAEKIAGAACIVYLTDMMGPFPEKCSKPLVWAATMNVHDKPPCGHVVFLKDM